MADLRPSGNRPGGKPPPLPGKRQATWDDAPADVDDLLDDGDEPCDTRSAAAPAALRGAASTVPPPPAGGDEADETADDSLPREPWRLRGVLRGTSSVFVSLAVHLVILVALGVVTFPTAVKPLVQLITSRPVPPEEEEEILKIELDDQFLPAQEITDATSTYTPEVGVAGGITGGGGLSGAGLEADPQVDTTVTEDSDGPKAGEVTLLGDAPPIRSLIQAAPDGALGDPRAIVDSYDQAMDQITREILWFMDKGNVLVVWCFDQSESMKDDQKEIRERIERVYTELGLAPHRADRLMTGVVSYGGGFAVHTEKPTSHRDKIRTAIDSVPIDPSGKEIMCEAVGRSIAQHREFAERTGRQMLLILVTDESGDVPNNNSYLERAIAEAKAAKCRCYVLGREAVFGYPYAYIHWTHPQTKRHHWLQIDRGPETAFVEQLQTDGFHRRYDAHPSGFGPYEQTRLARETGGVFFMLPSLETNLVRGEKRRYELEQLRRYRPDMRARLEVVTDRDASIMRALLWKVIYDLNPYQPDIAKIIEMRVHFSPDYPTFVQQARQEQAKAIVYLDYLAKAQQAVESVAEYRRQEASPRWEANYDLIHAQLIAYQARMYEYGAYLEWFINNPKVVPLTKAPNLTMTRWDITTRKELLTEKESGPYIARATKMYEQILKDHAGSPWAARAEHELRRGFGVEVVPIYEPPYPVIPPGTPLLPIPKL